MTVVPVDVTLSSTPSLVVRKVEVKLDVVGDPWTDEAARLVDSSANAVSDGAFAELGSAAGPCEPVFDEFGG